MTSEIKYLAQYRNRDTYSGGFSAWYRASTPDLTKQEASQLVRNNPVAYLGSEPSKRIVKIETTPIKIFVDLVD